MIRIKNDGQIALMMKACRIVEDTLKLLKNSAKVGMTTMELNNIAHEYITSCGGRPASLHYQGYPASICISVNDEVVHGIPGKYRIKDGDLVSFDVVVEYDGWYGDAARSYVIGKSNPEAEQLIKITRECFFKGIEQAKVGNRVSDISIAIQKHAESNGCGVVREMIGHGIGSAMHEQPEVPNYYSPAMGRGIRLQKGMTLAVEPMINAGRPDVWVKDDGWTVVTRDRKLSAHYENTIVITDGVPIIMTMQSEDSDD